MRCNNFDLGEFNSTMRRNNNFFRAIFIEYLFDRLKERKLIKNFKNCCTNIIQPNVKIHIIITLRMKQNRNA